MILKQGLIYKYVGKGKWIDAWYILSTDEKGPQLSLFRDSTAKKLLEAQVYIKSVTEKLRFGYTTRQFADRIELTKKDIRIDESSFIAFSTEKVIKKVTKNETIWLCATTVIEMFDIIKLIADCLTIENIKAPEANDIEDMDSLHRYYPLPFKPDNEWQKYYDSPQRSPSIIAVSTTMTKSASVDQMDKKTMKELKNKKLKKQKNDSRSMSALNDIGSDGVLSASSTVSGSSRQSNKTHVSSIFLVQDGSAPVQMLYRSKELADKPPLAPKPASIRHSRKISVSNSSEVTNVISPSPVPSERKALKSEIYIPVLPTTIVRGSTCDAEVQTEESGFRGGRPTEEPSTPISKSVTVIPVYNVKSENFSENMDFSVLVRKTECNEIRPDETFAAKVRDAKNPEISTKRRSSLGSASLSSYDDDFEDTFSRTQSIMGSPSESDTLRANYNDEPRMYAVEISARNA